MKNLLPLVILSIVGMLMFLSACSQDPVTAFCERAAMCNGVTDRGDIDKCVDNTNNNPFFDYCGIEYEDLLNCAAYLPCDAYHNNVLTNHVTDELHMDEIHYCSDETNILFQCSLNNVYSFLNDK